MVETSNPNKQDPSDLKPVARGPIEFSMERSPVLVIGIAGRIGSGASFVRDKILQSLLTFKYEIEIVDATKIMEEMQRQLGDEEIGRIDEKVNQDAVIGANDQAKRVRRFQLLGNAFRRNYGNSILAALCVTEFIADDLSRCSESLASRKAYIVDSLKHPDEARLLRSIFGSLFWLVGVVSSDMTRFNRLQQRKGFGKEVFEYLSEQDADGEDELDTQNKKNGQRTIDAVLEADYFFANDFATKDEIEAEAARLTRLIFGVQVVSPTQDECGMNMAFQASLQSACLSRQIGASIIAGSGDPLSTGHNDVPKFGGGLYGPVPADQDRRCWAWGAKCYNDEEKEKITQQVVGLLRDGDFINEAKVQDAVTALRKSRIKGLIEFTRAVHAEMEAIISVARSGKQGLIGSTLFTTTYPCHNCAKHVVNAGITRVVYLEPYEKSLARTLHPDAIHDPLQERSEQKVCFDNYGGVSPRRFSDFFKLKAERKERGVFLDSDRKRHTLSPTLQEEVSTLKERLKELQAWLDGWLSSDEGGQPRESGHMGGSERPGQAGQSGQPGDFKEADGPP